MLSGLWESTDASDVASARTPAHTVALDRNGAAGTLQHAQRGVYRKAELRAGPSAESVAGFVA